MSPPLNISIGAILLHGVFDWYVIKQAKLLEHNVRFGDPECQCLMTRLDSDLLQVLLSAASGQLQGIQLQWSPESAICVIMAAKGYPGAYAKNTPIRGLEAVSDAKASSSLTSVWQLKILFDRDPHYHLNLLQDNPHTPGAFLQNCQIFGGRSSAVDICEHFVLSCLWIKFCKAWQTEVCFRLSENIVPCKSTLFWAWLFTRCSTVAPD